MFNLSPKEDKFYDLFIADSEIVYESAKMLVNFVGNLDLSEENLKDMKEIEHKGDRKVHEIMEELYKTFLTPFDREDIYALAKEMDDIIDHIESASSRFVMFNVSEATAEAKTMCSYIEASTKEIIVVMQELKNMNKSKLLNEKIIKINKIEDDGDVLNRKAIKSLFREKIPTIEVIKWREIYQILEDTLDACEDVANLVEGVVMKNA